MEQGILPVKIDLAKTGLESCFKPYKVLMLMHAWAALSEDEPMGSNQMSLSRGILKGGARNSRISALLRTCARRDQEDQ